MSLPNEYLCDARIVAALERHTLSLNALRLFHGLLFCADRHSTALRDMGPPFRKDAKVLCRKVVAAVQPASTKDLRCVRTVIDELLASSLLSVLALDQRGRILTFRFHQQIVEASVLRRKNDPFAMLDTRRIAALVSPTQVSFYTRVTLHQRQKAPLFDIPSLNETGRSWSDVRDLWLGAAKRLSKETGHAYLFCPRVDPLTDHVVGMRVKVSHASTSWYPGRLYRRDADKPPTVVHAGTSMALTRSKALMREAWTHADRP